MWTGGTTLRRTPRISTACGPSSPRCLRSTTRSRPTSFTSGWSSTAQGVWDKDRFLAYLKLPRNVFYMNPLYLQRRENRDVVANLSADYSAADYLPPIRIDEPLVRSYLLHFFVDADNTDAYKPYVENDYLKNLFAEAKLTHGVGDPEKWYPLLTPEQLQALKDRIDIDFAYTNKDLFNSGDAVALDLDVKNVNTLIVKVFEINTPSFYETTHREVDTDVNLDGLVANEEKVYTYTDAPIRRLPRHFDFPNLKDRGVYIVEFIGNGKSSRALIRKGKLRYLEHVGAAGQVFTILDEANKPLPTATLWLAGKEFDPDKDGNILVPFSTNPGPQPIVLQTADGFASLDSFNHQAENYAFTAGIYVDRATLIKGGTSAVIIRPGLTVDGQPVERLPARRAHAGHHHGRSRRRADRQGSSRLQALQRQGLRLPLPGAGSPRLRQLHPPRQGPEPEPVQED